MVQHLGQSITTKTNEVKESWQHWHDVTRRRCKKLLSAYMGLAFAFLQSLIRTAKVIAKKSLFAKEDFAKLVALNANGLRTYLPCSLQI